MGCGCGGSKKRQAQAGEHQHVGPNGRDIYWDGARPKKAKAPQAPAAKPKS